MVKIILASSSPRRCELLKQMGLDFEIKIPQCEEIFDSSKCIDENLKIISYNKAFDVYRREQNNEKIIVIACDTVVVKDDEILTKPKDKADAYKMLSNLSGEWHQVKSGLTVMNGKKFISKITTTKVHFKELLNDEINWYIDTGEPFDKAGGYGIQGKGALLVDYIEGCYYNVVGLSIQTLYSILREEFSCFND